MTGPLISVIIPCYRQGRYLAETVGCLQAQTYPNWEAIIVNDGSPDDTAAIARALGQSDARVRYIEKRNGGLASARNAGLRIAEGAWVQFLDADDLLEPDKFTSQLEQLASVKGPAVSYCAYWHGAEDDPRVRMPVRHLSDDFLLARPVFDIALRWEWELSIPIHAALFDARLFRELGVAFDESLPNHEDWDMWMQVLRHDPTISYLGRELAIYRYSNASMSRNRELMRQGYLMANQKQSEVYQGDPVVVECLRHARQLIRYHYLESWQGRLRRRLESNAAYRRLCPWPVQKFLRHATRQPDLPAGLRLAVQAG